MPADERKNPPACGSLFFAARADVVFETAADPDRLRWRRQHFVLGVRRD